MSPHPLPLRFVIQKQDAATQLYDLRLEMGGVLKSWAIPKDPDADLTEKRLAVHTAEPQAGEVELWDEGTWIPKGSPVTAYRRGRLEFELRGKRMKGHWALVRMGNAQTRKKDLWLLVKREPSLEKAAVAPRIARKKPTRSSNAARR